MHNTALVFFSIVHKTAQFSNQNPNNRLYSTFENIPSSFKVSKIYFILKVKLTYIILNV